MKQSHGNQKHFYAGFDNGYGSVKLLVEQHPVIRIPSYISETDMEDVPGRVLVDGKAYTVGESAFRAGVFFDRNTDNNENKIKNAKITLFGALAHLPHRKEWELKLAVSLHDASLAEQLKEKLNGEFKPMLAGRESLVKVEVIKVVPEGVGCLAVKQVPERLTLLDFGNGTTLISRYFKGKRESHNPYPSGVEKLIELLSHAIKPLNGGKIGDTARIRYALECGNTKYSPTLDFKPVYSETLKAWYDKYLAVPVRAAMDAKYQGDALWAIGGGCLLPGFQKLLTKNGFEVLDNPVECNVQGLLIIAQKSK